MNIHTPFKYSNRKFFKLPQSIDTRFSSYDFGLSISMGPRPGVNLPNPKLPPVKEDNFEEDKREVSRILRRYEHSQDHEEIKEYL